MKKPQKTKELYFTHEHEEAIIKYIASSDPRERTDLYIKLIEPTFSEMVDKIIYTYRFTSLPNIDSLKQDCKVWLTTVIDKYDPKKGSKAFSYFSVITKNWFIHQTKKNAKKCQKEIQYEEISKELEQEFLSCNENYISLREDKEFWTCLLAEIQDWENILFLKENEKKVLNAIHQLLADEINHIEIFNKKAIYLYIREITRLNTKQVVNNLNRIRIKYRNFKSKWNNSEI